MLVAGDCRKMNAVGGPSRLLLTGWSFSSLTREGTVECTPRVADAWMAYNCDSGDWDAYVNPHLFGNVVLGAQQLVRISNISKNLGSDALPQVCICAARDEAH